MTGASGVYPAAREQRVDHAVDAFAVRREAQDLALALGFSRIEAVEIAIAASELTTNILKYGVRGTVRFEAVDDPASGLGIRVLAFDHGQPFRNFSRALEDGSDQDGPIDPLHVIGRGGIASGLGAVRRFSDELGWEPTAEGKKVWMIRYRKRRRAPNAG
jgi:anti-sigma regulatory factor (Ser/Thr protein kinase)